MNLRLEIWESARVQPLQTEKRKAWGTHESSRFSTDRGMLTAIEASSQNGPERSIAGTGVSSEVRRL